MCVDFGLNVFFLLFFGFLFSSFVDESLSGLLFVMIVLFSEVGVFGDSGGVIIDVHAFDVFFHFESFLVNVV